MPSDDAKKRLGREGEDLAASFLKQEGFKILEKNYRSRWGEIDLIAEKGADLFFVEVKTRRSVDSISPLELIPPSKQVHISRMAQKYVAAKGLGGRTGRFALVVVDSSAPAPRCELLVDIFDLAWGY